MEERTILKIALGFILVFILASSTFLVTALFSSNEDTATGMATSSILKAEKEEDDDNEEEEFDEDDLSKEELANLKTDISEEEAIQIALKRVNGEVNDIEIERKKGREVYAVEIDDDGDEVDVFVDIKTGEIVGTERDSEEDEADDD